MKTLKNLKISKRALLSHKMRTLLALLGVIIGVFAVIIMVSIGNGARSEVVSGIEAMGTNLLIVSAGDVRIFAGRPRTRGQVTTLTLQDAEAISREVPEVIAATPASTGKMQVKYGGYSTTTTITGVSPDFPTVRNFNVEKGWFFSATENRVSKRVAVLGDGVAENLFDDADPLGAVIRAGRVPFEVVGVMESKGVDIYGTDQDDQIFIPINTALRRVFNRDHIASVYLRIKSREDMRTAQAKVRDLLRERHGLNSGEKPDDFTIQSQTDLIEAQKETSDTFTTLTAGIAGISMVVGGIGILAVMLLSIRERRREIGLRMAVGARRFDVRLQFLFEAAILSVGGGLIGICMGVIASLMLKWILGWSIAISPFSIVLSFGFSLLTGLFFGVYPADTASRLDPIEALRSE